MKQRLLKLADVLVNHSTKVRPGDQVLIQSVTEIAPQSFVKLLSQWKKQVDMRMYQCATCLLRGN